MSDSIGKIERRQLPRHNLSLPVRFQFLDSRHPSLFEAVSRDIGLGGLSIKKTLKEEELGKEIILEIDLPEIQLSLKRLKGRLVWIERRPLQDKITSFGVRLEQLPAEEQDKLGSYFLKVRPHVPLKVKTIRPPDFKLSEKEKRNLEILDALRRKDPISKTQITQEINLNLVTVSNYVDEFRKKGVIFERGLDESSGGRRPSLLKINSEYGFIIGAELNLIKNYILVALVDFAFQVVNEKKVQIKEKIDNYNESLVEATIKAIEEAGIDRNRILGMGLGLTGSESISVNLETLLKEDFPLPLLIEDSAIASVFSELWLNYDIAKNENIIYVGLDGSLGMILKGEIYRGSNRDKVRMGLNAARSSNHGQRFCWLEDSCLFRQDFTSITADNVKELGEQFGVKIAFLINLLIPDVVIVGKVPEEVKVAFMDSLQEAAKRWAFSDSAKNTRIILSSLREDSVALGMAALVNRDIYSQI